MSRHSRAPTRRRPNQLRPLSLRANSKLARLIKDVLAGLPPLLGRPIGISVLPALTASRGRLLSGSPHCGAAVHAASFIRSRRIVVETRLIESRRLFRLILIHEIFHFVWARLGNSKRASFARLLEDEFAARAKRELGESADVKKAAHPLLGTLSWRDYVCESFCDTAAFLYSGLKRHASFTLAAGWIARRRRWFESTLAGVCRC